MRFYSWCGVKCSRSHVLHTVHADANIVELFVPTFVILQTTSFRYSGFPKLAARSINIRSLPSCPLVFSPLRSRLVFSISLDNPSMPYFKEIHRISNASINKTAINVGYNSISTKVKHVLVSIFLLTRGIRKFYFSHATTNIFFKRNLLNNSFV